jgi:hypothetical protein
MIRHRQFYNADGTPDEGTTQLNSLITDGVNIARNGRPDVRQSALTKLAQARADLRAQEAEAKAKAELEAKAKAKAKARLRLQMLRSRISNGRTLLAKSSRLRCKVPAVRRGSCRKPLTT